MFGYHYKDEEQLKAVIKVVLGLVAVDGEKKEEELKCFSHEIRQEVDFDQLGSSGTDEDFIVSESMRILREANEMSIDDALFIIRDADDSYKEYWAAFMGYIMYVDGDVDPAELKLWRAVTEICHLPSMTLREAYDIYVENYNERLDVIS